MDIMDQQVIEIKDVTSNFNWKIMNKCSLEWRQKKKILNDIVGIMKIWLWLLRARTYQTYIRSVYKIFVESSFSGTNNTDLCSLCLITNIDEQHPITSEKCSKASSRLLPYIRFRKYCPQTLYTLTELYGYRCTKNISIGNIPVWFPVQFRRPEWQVDRVQRIPSWQYSDWLTPASMCASICQLRMPLFVYSYQMLQMN